MAIYISGKALPSTKCLGFSLIEVMLAVGLLPLIVVAGVTVHGNYVKNVTGYIKRGGEEDIRRYIRTALNCDKTLSHEASICASGGAIQGFDSNDQALIPDANKGRLFHNAIVNLSCEQDAYGNTITALIKHPDEAEKDLFNVPIVCARSCGPDPLWGDTQTFPLGAVANDPFELSDLVRKKAEECGLPGPTREITRSTGAPKRAIQVTDNNQGVLHMESLNQACWLLGYTTYVTSSCWDRERSSRYPRGKCNRHSNHDETHSYYEAGQWRLFPKPYYRTWLTSLTCSGKRTME